jgi:long-chain acyl-CoA synthetase
VVATRDELPLDERSWRRATLDLPPMAPFRQFPFDDLPRTSTRKIQRPELARLVREGQPRSAGAGDEGDKAVGA